MGIIDKYRQAIVDTFYSYGGEFAKVEAKLAEETGQVSDGEVDEAELDQFAKSAGLSWIERKAAVSYALDEMDTSGNERVSQSEWDAVLKLPR